MSEFEKIIVIGTLEMAEKKILDHASYSEISPMDIQKIFEDLRKSILEGKEIK